MILTILLFLCGFTLSSISAIMSIIGLLSIFPAAPYTIGIMTGALEISKLVIASWMYRSWQHIPFFLKIYFVAALIVLMFLTSMACFGALSKAHMDSGIVSGESVAALLVVDEKIATQRSNIQQAKTALTQMDSQVNELMSRTTDEKGTDKAVKLRSAQKVERAMLSDTITTSQTVIAKLQNERSPLATAVRKVDAEVGPIRYIANIIYGDNIDSNVLEKAVRVVILMIVFVFDPLAVLLLIAANWNLMHYEKRKTTITTKHIETVEDITETVEINEPMITEVHTHGKHVLPMTTEVHTDDIIDNKSVNTENDIIRAASNIMSQSVTPDDKNVKSIVDAFYDERIPLATADDIDDTVNDTVNDTNVTQDTRSSNNESLVAYQNSFDNEHETPLNNESTTSDDAANAAAKVVKEFFHPQCAEDKSVHIGSTINATDNIGINIFDDPANSLDAIKR